MVDMVAYLNLFPQYDIDLFLYLISEMDDEFIRIAHGSRQNVKAESKS